MLIQFLFVFLFLPSFDTLVCPNGWTYFADRCWMKSRDEKSWFDADSECRQRYGAALATIQTEKESAFMAKLRDSDDSKFRLFDQSESTFLDCFVKVEKSALLGSSVMSPSNIKTAEQCVEECAKAKERYDQTCKSVLWYKDSKECVLNDKTRNDTDAVFVQDPELAGNIDYYEKTCETESENEPEILIKEKPKTSNVLPKKKKAGEISGIRTCFSKFKHSSLVGFVDRIHDNVTERECLSKCWRCGQCLTNEKEPCKSVVYYESVKQCILTKESRRTKPEYFDDSEPLATFYERRRECLFEMCEDQELDLVFAIDGSAKMNWFGFEKALRLVDSIVSAIHETTEFWKLTLVQVGTEGPAVVEIQRKSFNTLDDMRRALATVGWRRSPGNRLGDSLVDVADLAMRMADDGETDFVWMITLTPGFSDDSLDDFLMLKKKNYFTSFAIGVGSDLEFVNLEKIATSDSYLIHSQDSKMIVKNITSKLCPKTPEFVETSTVDFPEKKMAETEKAKTDEFVSKTDAYRTNPKIFYDDRARALTGKTDNRFKTSIRPSTIVFLGNSRDKNAARLKKFMSSGEKLKKLTSDFINSLRNDSVQVPEVESFWIGFKRSDLGPFEWSDGSKLDLFDDDKSKHLEVEEDSGDCIYWSSDLAWKQFDCFRKLQFVCNLRPTQTINEKLEHDFGNVQFDAQKNHFSADLETFSTFSPNLVPPPLTTPATNLFNWGPNGKFTTKTRPPSATPPNLENSSNQVDKLFESEKTSDFLVPFGRKVE